MTDQQSWRTEEYKGMDVHVTALPHGNAKSKWDKSKWDYTVRVTDPGVDSSAMSVLAAASGDDHDYSTEDDAVRAGFAKGYALVDMLKK